MHQSYKTVFLLSSFHRGNQGTELKEMGQGHTVVKWRGRGSGHHVSAGTERVQKRLSDTLDLELQVTVSCLVWCWELNSRPLQEQWALLATKLSLQLLVFHFKTWRRRRELDLQIKTKYFLFAENIFCIQGLHSTNRSWWKRKGNWDRSWPGLRFYIQGTETLSSQQPLFPAL